MKENDIIIVDATGCTCDAATIDKMICKIVHDQCYSDRNYAAVIPINNGDLQEFHNIAGRSARTWVINKKYLRPYEEGDIYV